MTTGKRDFSRSRAPACPAKSLDEAGRGEQKKIRPDMPSRSFFAKADGAGLLQKKNVTTLNQELTVFQGVM